MRIAVAFDHAGVAFDDIVGPAICEAGHDTYTAAQCVGHDDCNVLCVGSRVIGPLYAAACVMAFARAEFSGEQRHVRRLHKIDQLERRGFELSPPQEESRTS